MKARQVTEKKILFGLFAAFVAVILLSIASYLNSRDFIRSNEMVQHTHQVIEGIETLINSMLTAESTARGYALTGRADFIDQHALAVGAVHADLNLLRALTADNPAEVRNLDELSPIIDEKIFWITRLINVRRETGFEGTAEFVDTTQVRGLMRRIRQIADEMHLMEIDLLARRNSESQRGARRLILVDILLTAVIFVLLYLVYSLFQRDSLLRIRATEVLRESESRLHAILDNSPDLIYLKDLEGRYLFVNKEFERVFHIYKQAATGRTDTEILPREIAEVLQAHDKHIVATQSTVRGEQNLKVGDGYATYLSVSFPLVDAGGKPYAVCGMATDISERRRAEEERDRFFSLSLDLYCTSGLDGYFKYVNPAWERVLGFTREELLAKPWIEFVHPDDRESTLAEFNKAFEGHIVFSFEARLLSKDGGFRWLLWAATPLVEEKILYAAARDITERKRSEELIERLNSDLQRRNAQLEAANKELETFSYSVSHDLRAPLRSIHGFSQALQEDFYDKLDESGQDFIRRIKLASQRMGQLIDDMLMLSRITLTGMQVQRVNLTELAGDIIADLRSAHPDRKVEVSLEENLNVAGDSRLLQIALENLLGNAWKFTSKQAEAKIELGSTAGGNGQCIYFIRDNGAGFDMAFASKLFGAFQRLHGMDEFQGTGIGLATVQRIFNRHGGRIWAEAEVGKGATFYFTL